MQKVSSFKMDGFVQRPEACLVLQSEGQLGPTALKARHARERDEWRDAMRRLGVRNVSWDKNSGRKFWAGKPHKIMGGCCKTMSFVSNGLGNIPFFLAKTNDLFCWGFFASKIGIFLVNACPK